MEMLKTKEEVLEVLSNKSITTNFGYSNFAYKQRGINTAKAIENNLNNGWVSIIWNKVPKAHIKTVEELVSGLESYKVIEIKDGNIITPEHTLYLK